MSEPGKAVIMVVDDHPDTLALTQRHLLNAGYETVGASSGREALQMAPRAKADLILLDVVMPDMDGYQVCAQLQADPATAFTPVVFVTGLEQDQDRARAFAMGAVDYLVKPVRRETLLGIVRTHLETKSRWYQVRAATDLWDEVPLPQKFTQFRDSLVKRLRLDEETAARLSSIKSADIYQYADVLNVEESTLAQYMADFFGLSYVEEIKAETIQLGRLPSTFCRANYVVAVEDESIGPAFVIANPFVWGLAELDILNRAFDRKSYRLLLTEKSKIAYLFYDRALGTQLEKPGTIELTPLDELERRTISVEQLLQEASQATPVEIVNALISDAVTKGASDVHIEPDRERVRVRYRIDGRMRTVVVLQPGHLSGIVARIKVMSGMDLAETRKPQDGGMLVHLASRDLELRTSTLPTTLGEKIVLRIMGGKISFQSLDGIGMAPDTLRGFRKLLSATQGMVLVTGPTGSGKTTTLYNALGHLNDEDVNILTVEDPVEADLPGIAQVQIHERAGRGFSDVLRAMLRQDPDIIMIGEIRDQETAEIACRAALTGHLVLSTVHTQNTLGTLVRLFDMGVAPYLAASALNGVVAQRLVNRVCSSCDQAYTLPPNLHRAFELRFGDLHGARWRRGTGSARCHRTGTHGRVGVFELLTVDDDLRHLLTDGAPPSTLRAYVQERGFRTLEEDAFLKAFHGVIPPEAVVQLGLGLALELEDLTDDPPPALTAADRARESAARTQASGER